MLVPYSTSCTFCSRMGYNNPICTVVAVNLYTTCLVKPKPPRPQFLLMILTGVFTYRIDAVAEIDRVYIWTSRAVSKSIVSAWDSDVFAYVIDGLDYQDEYLRVQPVVNTDTTFLRINNEVVPLNHSNLVWL